MSYVSGFMMGAAIGKSIRQMMGGAPARAAGAPRRGRMAAPAAPAAEGLSLVSRLSGRRRYRARLTKELGALLEGALERLPFLRSVAVNAATGSILLTFDEADAAKVDTLADWLRTRIFAPSTPPHEACGEAADESHAGQLTRSVRGSARALSAFIKRSTGGWLDMSSALSLVFALRGLRKLLMTKASPSGAQMLWWALSLMRGWRTI